MTKTLERRTGMIAITLGVVWLVVCLGLAVFGIVSFSVMLALAFRGALVIMGLAALALLLGGFVFGRGGPRSRRGDG